MGHLRFLIVIGPFALLTNPSQTFSQTSGTGQIIGTVSDQTNAVVASASVTVTSDASGAARKATANETGVYAVPLLNPGMYSVTVAVPGFKRETRTRVEVQVATTTTVNVTLEVGQAEESVTVDAQVELLQTEAAANGGTVDGRTVTDLPLTNRNYTQILALNPGVSGQVPNAVTLGRNNVDVNVNGTRVMDNSYQMDGQDASNMQTQGTTSVVSIGGISVPSPDAIQEFRVQTSLYDASYGRGAGANVDVVTKSGTDSVHGSAFEFVRNDILNANDYFLNRAGQPRAVLKQNQFGGTVGGRLVKGKLFYFFSYQGTRQVNGLGSSSLQTVSLPLLTDDRSAAAIGKLFCGQSGKNGGIAVACDGSNVNPIALKLLNLKLSNGNYYIPTPTFVNTAAGIGQSSATVPSHYSENQYLLNTDYVISNKQQISERFFFAKAPQIQSFAGANVPGSGIQLVFRNYNAALKHSYVADSGLVNQLSAGFHRTHGTSDTLTPITAADLNLTPPCNLKIMPTISVTGSISLGGSGNDVQHTVSQTFAAQEQISWLHGKHNMRAGTGWEHIATPVGDPSVTRGSLSFLSFPDFILGMSAAQNGSAFSNINTSNGSCGDTVHSFRVVDYDGYFQDDYKVAQHLTLNLGMRWEIFGAISDAPGKLINFRPLLAQNVFGPSGTLSGLVVPSNFPFTVPDGVTKNGNKTINENSTSFGNVGPRFGFSWQIPHQDRMVLRGGYGIYYSRTSVNDAFQLFANAPFYQSISNTGVLNAAATFQNPFNPAPPSFESFPVWSYRTATSQLGYTMVDPHWQSPTTQQWTLNAQQEVRESTVLQIGYVGTRGEHLIITVPENQPYLASSTNSINGVTTNTLQNVTQRVPYLGLRPAGLSNHTMRGSAFYNGLQASLNKRTSNGVQFGIAYTYGNALTNVTGNGTFPNGGSSQNDGRNLRSNWGPADFDVKHRVIANFLINVPGVYADSRALNGALSGWVLSGVVTIQGGRPITFTDPRSGTIYGTSAQRAQPCPGATAQSIQTTGSFKSRFNSVAGFFDSSQFCAPHTIGNGFDFGDSARGLVRGPGQYNADLSLSKQAKLRSVNEASRLEVRAEFYNAFNTPQFGNPGSTVGALDFGRISATTVSPRIIQLGLKYVF
jgi:hypothetical protein